MIDHSNGHLATLYGDLDDLTAEEARRVPACDVTDFAVTGIMEVRRPRPTVTEAPVWEFDCTTTVCKQPSVPSMWRVSRDPRAAHEAREWLRGQGHQLLMRDKVDGDEQLVVVTSFQQDRHGKRPVDFAVAPAEHLATARLILVLYAEDLL